MAHSEVPTILGYIQVTPSDDHMDPPEIVWNVIESSTYASRFKNRGFPNYRDHCKQRAKELSEIHPYNDRIGESARKNMVDVVNQVLAYNTMYVSELIVLSSIVKDAPIKDWEALVNLYSIVVISLAKDVIERRVKHTNRTKLRSSKGKKRANDGMVVTRKDANE